MVNNLTTYKNLTTAFLNETQICLQYEFFAKIAKKEGFEQISEVFLETSEHERAHASRLFKLMNEGVVEVNADFYSGTRGTTIENLRSSLILEASEIKNYMAFEQFARQEGLNEMAAAFKYLGKAELFHQDRFKKFLNHLENDTLFKSITEEQWLCRKCGYVLEGNNPPEKCPACLHPKGYFERISKNY